ncbi:MAG: ferric reductase-like transmembrane domain-containing protein [Deltaproteobacteria bacterium]|nr:ferric reductase-like transmembrane domain-containing protein [Deltaproteobacteria bacterium]
MGSGTKERSSEDISLLERVSETPGQADGGTVDAHELQRQLGLASLFFARRLISALGGDRHDQIDRALLISRVEALVDGSPDDKLRFAFRVHDANGDGSIDVEELTRMLWTSLAENRLAFGPEVVDELVAAMFDHADENGDGVISYEEFAGAITHYPGVVEHMTLGDLRWLGLGPEPAGAGGRRALVRPKRPTWAGTGYIVLVAGWALANVALFVDAWLTYGAAGANVYIQVGRGFGATLNLGAALVLVPMMRRTLTRLGRTRVGRVLIDEHVLFHRLVGNATLVFAVAHTAAHLANWATGGGDPAGEGGGGGILGIWAGLLTTAGLTGVGLLVVHVLLSVFARDAIRRSRSFELFHAVHRLWPLWFVFILMHGPVTWIWVAAPLTGYVIDKFFARRLHGTRTASLDALPARVTRIVLERPRGFEFEAGDYVFLRIPEIAQLEWHPFTISNAPEDSAQLTFHVRTAGNWTGALREMAEAEAPLTAPLTAFIDGPYGTPSAHIFRSKRTVLVAAGIGVTPFASILRSMLMQLRADPNTDAVPGRVHFVWVCRSQYAFAWFASLLAEVEGEFPHRFDFRIFMDAGNRDIKSTVLRIAMDLLYAQTRQDLITGLRSRTTLGAPRWAELMRSFAREHAPDLPEVFFCGPPGLGKKARRAAAGEGLPFRQEHF